MERRVPMTERSTDSRRGRYFVTDPYLRFYYRFLAAYQSKLAMGQQQQMLVTIDEHLPEFIQANTWQELCQEWLLLASAQDEIPAPIEEVGSEWKRSFTIDVVGISEADRSLVLGCCLWNTEPLNLEPMHELVKRTSAIIPKGEEDWQIYFVGFAAGGWTETAVAEANAVIVDDKVGRARRKWQATGIRLVDLDTIDEDLERWSDSA
ncbi:MAG: DUF234 domain-containing protein [Chloroflexi bacterium]|nr:DUF234 domain-containing protein [Chloroflexota bacterium]